MNEPVLTRLNNLMQLRQEVETLATTGPWEPAADWLDEGTHLVLMLDVPGVDPQRLELLEEGDEVTVAGERTTLLHAEPLRRERPLGTFSRTMRFPEPVVSQSAQAQLGSGVLTVRFEKRQKTLLQLGSGE
ncbi:Hsp20/alpha crystallin family protein [Deinococcus sonorensis]|uniref:Hsp20/alpha crystallin family protein n=2 Tax=Deinococcus sonorensis TaxID=309891 RepID=A0AAU7U9S3_9DEIO